MVRIGQDWCYIEEIHFIMYKTVVSMVFLVGTMFGTTVAFFEMIMWLFKRV